MDEKDLAEYVIKRIMDGDVFFIAEDFLISMFEEIPNVKFERTDKQVKLRGFNGTHKLYFIKKDEKFQNSSREMVLGAGANFETLLGLFCEGQGPVHVHVYNIGPEFDLDKMSEMVYSLFTELGPNHILEFKRTLLC